MTEVRQMYCECPWDRLSNVSTKQLSNLAHNDQQGDLARNPSITFLSQARLEVGFPSFNTVVFADYTGPGIEDRKMLIAYVQQIPDPNTVHNIFA